MEYTIMPILGVENMVKLTHWPLGDFNEILGK